MTDHYFTFRSITKAQAGERALGREGLHCVLLRAPKILSANGCGYVLKIRGGEVHLAAAALRLWGIEFGKVYRFMNDGSAEEVIL